MAIRKNTKNFDWAYDVEESWYFQSETRQYSHATVFRGTRISPGHIAFIHGHDTVDRDGVETHRVSIMFLFNGIRTGIDRNFPKRKGKSLEHSTKRRACNIIKELKEQGAFELTT